MLHETPTNRWLIDFDLEEAPACERRSWPAPLASGILIGALLATAISSLAGAPSLDLRSLGVQPTSQPAVGDQGWPERELPREWRWERKAVTFDHMFRAER